MGRPETRLLKAGTAASARTSSVTRLFKAGEMTFGSMTTRSPRMQACLRLAARAARADVNILITGETGTGKNVLAQAIHNAGRRASGPCVIVNCTAMPETLLESELFGHEKGAFTGAQSVHKGRFEAANGGTLILDEIGDMSLPAQAKILRAVEYRQFERVGSQKTLSTDVRLIAITNRDLQAMVREKLFREDLLYRLYEFHIPVPPLRERREDLPLLCAEVFQERKAKFGLPHLSLSTAALELLKQYSWPGNLRELRAVLGRAAIGADRDQVYAEDLGLSLLQQAAASPAVAPHAVAAGTAAVRSAGVSPAGAAASPDALTNGIEDLTLESSERQQIVRVLGLTKGNKRRACELLGISRPTLDRKINDLRIDTAGISETGEDGQRI